MQLGQLYRRARFGKPIVIVSGLPRSGTSMAKKMLQAGEIPGAPDDRLLLALGFNLAHPEINVAIVGTLNPEHMRNNLKMVESSLPIQYSVVKEIHQRFQDCSAVDPEEWKQRG